MIADGSDVKALAGEEGGQALADIRHGHASLGDVGQHDQHGWLAAAAMSWWPSTRQANLAPPLPFRDWSSVPLHMAGKARASWFCLRGGHD